MHWPTFEPGTFMEWLTHEARRIWLLVVIASGLPASVTAVLRRIPWPSKPWSGVIPYYCTVLGIFILLCIAWQEPFKDEKDHPGDSKAIDNFHLMWCLWWLTWLVMYIVLSAKYTMPVLLHVNSDAYKHTVLYHLLVVMANFFGNATNVFAILCYAVLIRREPRGIGLPWVPWVSVLVFITTIEMLLVLVPVIVMHDLHQELLTVTMIDRLRFVIDLAYGLVGGISLALLIGRLDSKFILPPAWAVGLLYFYAILQGAFAPFKNFPQLDTFQPYLYAVAGLLKGLLFLLVHWTLRSGVLLYYMHNVRFSAKEILIERNDFIERYK